MSQEPKNTNITSYNQTGGITAHTVNINNESLKRDLKNSAAMMTGELKKCPIATYRIHFIANDQEAVKLAEEIDQILVNAKWHKLDPISGFSMSTTPYLPKGVTIYMLKQVEPILTLTNHLWRALGNKGVEGQVLQGIDNVFKVGGWPPVELPAEMNGVVICVGANPEN